MEQTVEEKPFPCCRNGERHVVLSHERRGTIKPTGQSLDDLKSIELELKEVNEAKAEYELITAEQKSPTAAHPDGSEATSDISQIYCAAVDRYRMAMKAFGDFIILGKLPDR